MFLAVLIGIVGVGIGLLMLFKPREVWQVTESWKFRNPDANEPSDVSYFFSGIGTIIGSLIVAVTLFSLAATKPDTTNTSTQTTTRYAPTPTYGYTPPPPKPFTAPAPQNRGALPMIGYLSNDGIVTVYYYAPIAASAEAPADRPRACDVKARIEGADTDHVVVNVDLVWAPTVEADANLGWQCRTNNEQDPMVARSLVIGRISPTAELITSKPLPNMRLPRLAEPPRPLADPPAQAH